MIAIDNKFDVQQSVYVKTDIDQKVHIVVAIVVTPKDVLYRCSCGNITQDYYDFELSTEVNVLVSR